MSHETDLAIQAAPVYDGHLTSATCTRSLCSPLDTSDDLITLLEKTSGKIPPVQHVAGATLGVWQDR
jgi:hypothetical protein